MTRFEIICDGELINKNSDGGIHYGWGNPFDSIPQIGSVIEYMTFDEENYKKGEGILTSYKVVGIKFYTRETMNYDYRDKTCTIIVDKQ